MLEDLQQGDEEKSQLCNEATQTFTANLISNPCTIIYAHIRSRQKKNNCIHSNTFY